MNQIPDFHVFKMNTYNPLIQELSQLEKEVDEGSLTNEKINEVLKNMGQKIFSCSSLLELCRFDLMDKKGQKEISELEKNLLDSVERIKQKAGDILKKEKVLEAEEIVESEAEIISKYLNDIKSEYILLSNKYSNDEFITVKEVKDFHQMIQDFFDAHEEKMIDDGIISQLKEWQVTAELLLNNQKAVEDDHGKVNKTDSKQDKKEGIELTDFKNKYERKDKE